MKIDKYGQQIFSEKELLDVYQTNPDIKLKTVLTSDRIIIDPNLELKLDTKFVHYLINESDSISDFDQKCKDNWFLPDLYKDMDIAKFVLDQCKSEAELQRAGEELLIYQERDMFILLKYLKYLVDIMRKNNILWGVGRGSSVSSFVLYLIGIHRIDSLYYDLPVSEFLK